ncbi:PQQ-binding-like beta-propeller repeat protein [Elusimicrobiota bacterium]
MKNFKKIMLLNLLFLAGQISVNAKSWPVFMADNARTGYTYEQAGGTLTYRWSYDTFANSIASPVVKDGIVFAGNRSGALYAFDARTGDVVWQDSLEGWIDATPCAYSGSLYVFSREGELYSFDLADGAVNWNIDLGGKNLSSPVVVGGDLYVGTGAPDKHIKCIDAATGASKYSYSVKQPVWSSPLYYDGFIYVAVNDGSIYKLNNKLELSWEYTSQTGMFRLSTPFADDGYVYFSPGDALRRVYSINTYSTFDWQSPELNKGGSGVFTSSVVGDDSSVYVVMSSTVQVLYCLQKDNGSLRWYHDLGANSEGESYIASPAVTYDSIYCGSESGYIYSISTSGTLGCSYLVDPSSAAIISSPAVSNGYVYVMTKHGKLYAYESSRIASISLPDEGDVVENTLISIEGSAVNTDFQDYQLYFATGTLSSAGVWVFISSGTSEVDSGVLGILDASALADGDYCVKLEVNSISGSGRAMNSFIINSPPEPPTAVSAGSTPFGSIKVNWTASSDDGTGDGDVAGYRIYRKTGAAGFDYNDPLASVSAGNTQYTDEEVLTETVYHYVMRSFDAYNDSGDSNITSTATYKNTVMVYAATGGTVELSDGTGVYFPPGALKYDSQVAVSALGTGEIPSGDKDHSGSWVPVDRAWEFEVDPDETFNKNVTVKLSYTDSDIAGLDESRLRVYWFDESAGVWRIVDTSVPFQDLNQVHAFVPHFTVFRIAQYISPDNIISKESTYVYPNPARGSEIYFKFRLLRAADIEIRVFNIAGDIIEELESTYGSQDEGKTQEIRWDIEGVSSGVYIWYIKAEGSGMEDELTGKAAIIR